MFGSEVSQRRDLSINAFLTPSSCNTSDEEIVFGWQPASRTISEAQCTYYMPDGLST